MIERLLLHTLAPLFPTLPHRLGRGVQWLQIHTCQLSPINSDFPYFVRHSHSPSVFCQKWPNLPILSRDLINHQSVGPQPVIFEQDQLISFLAGPPNHLIFIFKANRWYIKPADILKGSVKQHMCWSCRPAVVQSLIKPLFKGISLFFSNF